MLDPRAWRRRRVLKNHPLPEATWRAACADLHLLDRLDAEEQARLRDLATLFLHDKVIEAAAGLQLSEPMRATIAVQACVPILNLDLDWYARWSSVIVYPAEFVPCTAYTDDAGVVHTDRSVLSGQAWLAGPVILSWSEVAAAGERDGHNVVIHELAHKLDMLNGAANGMPPLHRGMAIEHWTEAFTRAFEDLRARRARAEAMALDPYATESPAEFFAVACETFFETPEGLAQAYPQVYAQLAAFYRQDPAGARSAWISA